MSLLRLLFPIFASVEVNVEDIYLPREMVDKYQQDYLMAKLEFARHSVHGPARSWQPRLHRLESQLIGRHSQTRAKYTSFSRMLEPQEAGSAGTRGNRSSISAARHRTSRSAAGG